MLYIYDFPQLTNEPSTWIFSHLPYEVNCINFSIHRFVLIRGNQDCRALTKQLFKGMELEQHSSHQLKHFFLSKSVADGLSSNLRFEAHAIHIVECRITF